MHHGSRSVFWTAEAKPCFGKHRTASATHFGRFPVGKTTQVFFSFPHLCLTLMPCMIWGYAVVERLSSGFLCHQTKLDKAVGELQVVKQVGSCRRCRTLLGSRVMKPDTLPVPASLLGLQPARAPLWRTSPIPTRRPDQ